MIHQYKLSGYNIVLDVYSGSVHAVDDVAYDAIALIDQGSSREQAAAALAKKYADRADVTAADISDVLDDIASHGRVYIPASEMEAFGVSRADLLERPHADNCRRLFAFMYFRAKHFFNKSRRLLQAEDKRALAPALVMWAIYEEILETIKKRGFLLAASCAMLWMGYFFEHHTKLESNEFFEEFFELSGYVLLLSEAYKTELISEGKDTPQNA